MESLREIIFSRKKEASGLETTSESCSAGVDKWRMDSIVFQSDLGFLEQPLIHSRFYDAYVMYVNVYYLMTRPSQ